MSIFSNILSNFWKLQLLEEPKCSHIARYNIFEKDISIATNGILTSHSHYLISADLNPFFPNALFRYPLKTSEKLTIFWCFHGVEKGWINNEWVKTIQSGKYDHNNHWLSNRSFSLRISLVNVNKSAVFKKILDTNLGLQFYLKKTPTRVAGLKYFAILTGKNLCWGLF